MRPEFPQDNASQNNSPFVEPPKKGGATCAVVSVVSITALVFIIGAILALSSVMSFLTSCDTDPSTYWKLQEASAEASEYWKTKYNEDVAIVSAEYERVPSSLFPTVTEDIIMETSDGWRIFKRAKDGLISDNRQAREINLALETWLESAFEQTASASNEDGITWIEPCALYPSQVIEGAASSSSNAYTTNSDATELADDEPTLLFSTWMYAENSSEVSWCSFSTYYDGDIDAFLEAAAQTRELEISSDCDIVVAIDDSGASGTKDAEGVVLPSGYSKNNPPEWTETANELAHTLDYYFSARPQITVLYETQAEKQLQDHYYNDSIYTLGWYNSRSEIDFDNERAEAMEPVVISWVALDNAEGLFVASAEEGCVLTSEDVRLEIQNSIGLESINTALSELDDSPIELLSDVWSLEITDEAQTRLLNAGGQSPNLLLYANADFKASQGIYSWDEIPLEESWTSYPMLYSFEVASISDTGALEVGTTATSYGITSAYFRTLTYDVLYVQDTNDELLLFTARQISD